MCLILQFIIRNIYLDFTTFSCTELLNLWNFLSAESDKGAFCYAKEVTLGKHKRIGSSG